MCWYVLPWTIVRPQNNLSTLHASLQCKCRTCAVFITNHQNTLQTTPHWRDRIITHNTTCIVWQTQWFIFIVIALWTGACMTCCGKGGQPSQGPVEYRVNDVADGILFPLSAIYLFLFCHMFFQTKAIIWYILPDYTQSDLFSFAIEWWCMVIFCWTFIY